MKMKRKILEQDLTQKERPGSIFVIHLLMKEKCEMPSKQTMTSIMEKHLGKVECFCYGTETAGFIPLKYKTETQDRSVPPQLMIMDCMETDNSYVDDIARSQMWDCENSDEILEECHYQVVATDLLRGGIRNYKNRADMLMDFMEALVELYPECVAVLFQSSGKLYTREKIVGHQIPREDRFIYFAVNVRYFQIQGTKDSFVDSLGMSILYLPDLQYHFHGMNPSWVVNHAYNLLSYIYENRNPIRDFETIDGIVDGRMEEKIRWKCHYENSLVQPAREVLDIYMNEYASGIRE